MMAVLITGATGNVGSRLVKAYLKNTNHNLFVIVRGDSEQHCEERMQKILTFWDCSAPHERDRIHVIRGDITQPNFGLSIDQIKYIGSQVKLFIHAASIIRLDLTEDEARNTILGGTQNAFSLAQRFPLLNRFGYVSTMEVAAGCDEVITEDYLPQRPKKFLNTYELGKFESEEYLRNQTQSSIPITIFRPSMVVGESTTGKALGFQSFYLMLEKMLLNPDYPILPLGPPIDTIPVDILAEGILALMASPKAAHQVYHLIQGLEDRVEFQDFINNTRPLAEAQLRRKIKKPRYISPIFHKVILGMLTSVSWGQWGRSLRIQNMFIKFLFVTWRIESVKTRNALQSLGVEWPSFNTYLPNILKYYSSHRHEKRLPF